MLKLVSVAYGMLVMITEETKDIFGVLRLCCPSELRKAASVSLGQAVGQV